VSGEYHPSNDCTLLRLSEKYPTEALQIDNDNLADVQAHYEYLADHEAINEKLDALKK
jgi:hypothetical protein